MWLATLYALGHALMVVGNHDDRFLRWLWGRRVQVKHGLEQTTAEFNEIVAEYTDITERRGPVRIAPTRT